MTDNQPGLFSKIKTILLLTLCGLLLIFALQNSEQVTVAFLLWEMTLPRVVVLFIFFCAGIILGLFLGRGKITRVD